MEGDEVLDMGARALGDLRGRRVAMIFQEPTTAFDPVFTIGQQIAETIRRHTGKSETDAWKRALELLELVRIPSPAQRLKAYPHEMSGGMRQRAMIALALSCNPKPAAGRRADHGARRDRADPGPAAAPRAAARARSRRDLRHPRHRRGGRGRRPHRRDVCRQDRRAGAASSRWSMRRSIPTAAACSPRRCMAACAASASRPSRARRPISPKCRPAAASRRAASSCGRIARRRRPTSGRRATAISCAACWRQAAA